MTTDTVALEQLDEIMGHWPPHLIDPTAARAAWAAANAAEVSPETLVRQMAVYLRLCARQNKDPMALDAWLLSMSKVLPYDPEDAAVEAQHYADVLASGVRAFRAGFGWTQDELALRANLSKRGIVKIEAGDQAGVKMSSVASIAKAFTVDVSELIRTGERFHKL